MDRSIAFTIMSYEIYVCSIVGSDVYHDSVILGAITHLSDLDKIRDLCRERYSIEFEELASRFKSGWLKFANISDERDVALVVERIRVFE